MEMVYLINGGESGGGGGSGGGATAGYPIVKAVVTDGAVGLQDRSVTRVELKTSNPVRINFPPKTEGVVRVAPEDDPVARVGGNAERSAAMRGNSRGARPLAALAVLDRSLRSLV